MVQSNSIGGNASTAPATYSGPTTTQAGKAVAFAYAQLGCPYVYGAHRAVQFGLRLLRPGPGRVGVGRRRDPA